MSLPSGARRGPPVSPCVKWCEMDADDRWCLGCRRSRAEIAGWWALSDAQKWAVLDNLPGRTPRPRPDEPDGAGGR